MTDRITESRLEDLPIGKLLRNLENALKTTIIPLLEERVKSYQAMIIQLAKVHELSTNKKLPLMKDIASGNK